MLRNVFAAFRKPEKVEEFPGVTVYVWHTEEAEYDDSSILPGTASRVEAYDIAWTKLAEDVGAVRVRVEFKPDVFVEAERKAA